MSRNRKDGRRGGAHVGTQNKEVWSARCPRVNGDRMGGRPSQRSRNTRNFKWYTHRHERRVAREEIARQMDEMQEAA